MERELLAAGGLDGGQHDRELGTRAAGHHRVDRDLLDCRPAAVGRDHAHQLLRIAGGVIEHRYHPLGGRRHDRQPIGQPPFVHRLKGILELAELELARRDPPRGPRAPRRQSRRDLRVARARSAAGTHRGQSIDRERGPGLRHELHQPIARESDHPLALGAVLEQEHGRDRIGVKAL